jgi:hypothetical protein
MKHIKLFEDYSDEEIEALLGDLETIGHSQRLIPGKDFGFGESDYKGIPDRLDLTKENSWRYDFYIKKDVVDDLIKRGIMERSKFELGVVYFTPKAGLSKNYPAYEFTRRFSYSVPSEDTDYALKVSLNVRMDRKEKEEKTMEFSQEIYNYLSSLRLS